MAENTSIHVGEDGSSVIELELIQGQVTGDVSGTVIIKSGGAVVAKVEAKVGPQFGTDHKTYPVVTLTAVVPDPPQRPRTFGARPPPDLEWQLDKTAASITFVRSADAALANPVLDPKEKEILRGAIAMVKRGALVLNDFVTPEEYLARSEAR